MTFLLRAEDLISPEAGSIEGSVKKAYVLLRVYQGIIFFQRMEKAQNLYSDACQSEKATLADCLEEFCGITMDSIQRFSQSSILCYECCVKLNKIKKFEKDIKTLKMDISQHFLPASNETDVSGSQCHTYVQLHTCHSVKQTSQCTVANGDDDSSTEPIIKKRRVTVSLIFSFGCYKMQIVVEILTLDIIVLCGRLA